MLRTVDDSSGAPAELREILEVAPRPIYALDDDGHFTFVNEELVETSGYARSNLLGEHVSLVLDDEAIECCQSAIRALLESGSRSRTVDVIGETASGRSLRVEIELSLLPLDSGFQGTVGVVTDVESE